MESSGDAMKNLDYSSLVSRIVRELESIFGFGDRAIAEFMIKIGRNSSNAEEFGVRLKEQSLPFFDSLAASFLEVIHQVLPPKHKPVVIDLDADDRNTTEFDEPELNRVYTGIVCKVEKLGFFVKLDGFKKNVEGLVSCDKIADTMVSDANKVVKIGQEVHVKVLSVSGTILSLSMKGVDQRTTKGLVSPAVEIEVSKKVPAFLQGKSDNSVDVSPVKIVRNPAALLSHVAAVPSVIKGAGWSAYKDAFRESDSFVQRSDLPIEEQRKRLPIYKLKDELVRAVNENQVLVVIGETGSGVTTQLPQYLADAGYGRIGCVEPRGSAVIFAAKMVAEEFGCKVGEQVGYRIVSEDRTGPSTEIKFMSDDMLVKEILRDEDLSQYSVIVVNEAHERNVTTDIALGLMKKVLSRRSGLRLIVASATPVAEKFSGYFLNCRVFRIPGRSFPVDIVYWEKMESDYVNRAVNLVLDIHSTEPNGDILVFLPGEEDIDLACQSLADHTKKLGDRAPELFVLPVYGAFPSEILSRIFESAPPGKRKVVVATTIAEASLTIDGIVYVIDSGFQKLYLYSPNQAMDSLALTRISQESARQRAGLVGRGKCYRLYSKSAFNDEMSLTTVPEIQRVNLGATILRFKSLGLNDLFGFDFVDPPSPQSLVSAMQLLYSLGALDEEGLITDRGRIMAEFPLDPPLSKMILASVELGCSDEILTIIAMVQTGNIFYRPREKEAEADQKRSKFYRREGDHLALLAVYEAWKAQNFSSQWCFENFVQPESLKRVQDRRNQLNSKMDMYRLKVVSSGKDITKIRKAITAGLFFHAARKDSKDGYRTVVGNQAVYIHPRSFLFERYPEWVVYSKLVQTRKDYMHDVIAIDLSWLVEMAPEFFKKPGPAKTSKRRRV